MLQCRNTHIGSAEARRRVSLCRRKYARGVQFLRAVVRPAAPRPWAVARAALVDGRARASRACRRRRVLAPRLPRVSATGEVLLCRLLWLGKHVFARHPIFVRVVGPRARMRIPGNHA